MKAGFAVRGKLVQCIPTVLSVLNRPDEEGETKNKKGAPEGKRGELDVERKKSDPSAILLKSNQPTTTANRLKHLVGKKPAKRRSAGQTSAVR